MISNNSACSRPLLLLTFFVLISTFSTAYAEKSLKMDMEIQIFMPDKKISGTARFDMAPGEVEELDIGGIEISSIEANDLEADYSVIRKRLKIGPFASKTAIKISFQKKLHGTSPDMGGNFISEKGINLISDWHPTFHQPAIYMLNISAPHGFRAVSEADTVKITSRESGDEYHFLFPHPREGVTFVAGRYTYFSDRYNDIDIEAYFHAHDEDIAPEYIGKVKDYIAKYEQIFGPYPFKRFAVVENSMPTGLGMATYTLLGSRIIRLPFIADISLGHEFVHSWFGNSVYVSRKSGNWSEGLTTFFSDYLYQEETGHGVDYRHDLLTDYQSYVHDDNDMALEDFLNRFDRASKAIGYGKGTMFFHMLKMETGFNAFNRSIKRLIKDYRFKAASWNDIEKIFSEESKKDLKPFFEQWLKRTDIPDIKLKNASIKEKADGQLSLLLTIQQKTSRPYTLNNIPLIIKMISGQESKNISLYKKETQLELPITNRAISVTVDPDLDIMRQLAPEEYPPVLSRLFGSCKKFAVNLEPGADTYKSAMEYFTHAGFTEIKKQDLKHSLLREGAFLFLGKPSGMLAKIAPDNTYRKTGSSISVMENIFNPDEVICFIKTSSKRELNKVIPKLIHYGKYSHLEFTDGKIVQKDVTGSRRGIRKEVEKPVPVIASSAISNIGAIIKEIADRDIIYIGEQHDQSGHHQAELRVIEALYAVNPNIAVGMEMFQYPFQKYIDAYMDGSISEKEFLRKTEYFKRWRFNYRLYRPIVEFCRRHKIPVVALNLPGEISRKVAKEGLEALTPDQRRMLPENLDFSNMNYQKRLETVFKEHKGKVSNFKNFYQAQICWDETMARQAAEYIKSHPEKKMIILAGNGHIERGSGIPDRVNRYGNFTRAILINCTGSPPEADAGDFFLFPREAEAPFSAKLGILIDDSENALVIKEVSPGSPAAKGGLKPGDRIIKLDDAGITDITDLRLELFFKKEGERARVTVIRKDPVKQAEEKITLKTGRLVPFSFSQMSPHGPMKSIKTKKKEDHNIEHKK